MISARDCRAYLPRGELHWVDHPQQIRLQKKQNSRFDRDHHAPLLKALHAITIKGSKYTWQVREHGDTCGDDELYIRDKMVVWSRGHGDNQNVSQIIKTFTMDTPVQQALWCSFLLPVDEPVQDNSSDSNDITVHREQQGVCILETHCISIMTTEGCDFVTTLPFPVSRAWPMKNGLLFERLLHEPARDVNKTPKKSSPSLPVLFSLLHPLDEAAPVICRTGGPSSHGKTSYVTEVSQCIVFSSSDPSLIMTYDKILSVHALWRVRNVHPEENLPEQMVWSASYTGGPGLPTDTPASGFNHSTGGMSRFTLSSQSPSLSPFGASWMNNSTIPPVPGTIGGPGSISGLSRGNSPSVSWLAQAQSCSTSPLAVSLNMDRFGIESCGQWPSPGNGPWTPMSVNNAADQSFAGSRVPLTPSICLDHLWTESGKMPRDGAMGKASKVFLAQDLCDQRYVCYVIPYRHQLRCVKYDHSNDDTVLIFGSMTTLSALDAEPIKALHMMLVLQLDHSLILYSGTSKMKQVYLPVHSIVKAPPGSSIMASSRRGSECAFGTPPRFSSRPVTSSRPPSALDPKFDDDVQLLSPVPTEPDDSSHLVDSSSEISLSPDLNYSPDNSLCPNEDSIVALRDSIHSRLAVEFGDGTLYRISLPDLAETALVRLGLTTLRQVLPRDVAHKLMINWYTTINAPGGDNSLSEWTQFCRCILTTIGYEVDQNLLAYMGKLSTPVESDQQDDNDNSEQNSEQVDESMPMIRKKKRDLSPLLNVKKRTKPSDQGSDKDWLFLLNSTHHSSTEYMLGSSLGLPRSVRPCSELPGLSTDSESMDDDGGIRVDPDGPLYNHSPVMLFSLHLLYEELKLNQVYQIDLQQIAALLIRLSIDLGYVEYTDHYRRDHPVLFKVFDGGLVIPTENISVPSFMTASPPSIYQWLYNFILSKSQPAFPYMPAISTMTHNVITLFAVLLDGLDPTESSLNHLLRKVCVTGNHSNLPDASLLKSIFMNDAKEPMTEVSNRNYERAVEVLVELDDSLLSSVVSGVWLPLAEALHSCRINPPSHWSEKTYNLIGREDLSSQCNKDQKLYSVRKSLELFPGERGKNSMISEGNEDGMEYLDQKLLQLRFSEDLRVQEVCNLLQSCRPVKISLTQKPEVSDHEFIEEQEVYLYSICTRTMALPVGRGMLTLNTHHPVATEALPIPKLCLTGRVPPRNTTVDLSHIDTPVNMGAWPSFHNGVATGLRTSNKAQLDSAWILYNRAHNNELTAEHAGFLMGLGLNGHLSSLKELSIHDYLCNGDELTSVGLLLGVAVGKRGTMDQATTRILGIHVAALLPPTSTELDVSHNVQVSAVLSIGLVYQGTAHRHFAEVLLAEIGRPPGPEMDNCVDRESYSLAAGLALGLVMLGRGGEAVGLSDLNIADELVHFMKGGHKRPLGSTYNDRFKAPSYQIKEGDSVNVDVTSPGATLALGMMFFDTSNSAVAEWLQAPDTQFLLDFVRPDFLLIRTLSRGLVMWSNIHPSEDWILSNLPSIIKKYSFKKVEYVDDVECDIDFETMSQAYCNIVAGACMAIGLRFAGSANQQAFDALFAQCHYFLKLMNTPVSVDQAGKSIVDNCLVVIVLSLAMVMAGTGDLDVLRICRHLRARVGTNYSYVLYGSHMAVSMAIGLLFIGGGRYTLSTTPEAVGAMLCAFFPKFPIHSNDNRYHLQAFRHLYMLAVEPRVIIPTDVDTKQPCHLPLKIKFKDTPDYKDASYEVMAPCLLPELSSIEQIQVLGPRYWPIEFHCDKNWSTLSSILNGSGDLHVKKRAGYLPYAEDPKEYRSLLSKFPDYAMMLGFQSADVRSLCSDPSTFAFAEYFCRTCHTKDFSFTQQLIRILSECVNAEKVQAAPLNIKLNQLISNADHHSLPLQLWQIRLMLAFYKRVSQSPNQQTHRLLTAETITAVSSQINHYFNKHLQGKFNHRILTYYLSGKSINIPLTSTEELQLLSCFLTWHGLPPANKLPTEDFNKLFASDKPLSSSFKSFGKVYGTFAKHGFSVSMCKTLLKMSSGQKT